MATPFHDPWLAARMADRAAVARAEAVLYPAIRAAVAAYLDEVTREVLGTPTTRTAAAFARDTDPPDLNGFPDDSFWTRLVDGRIRPASRRVFDRAWLAISNTRDRLQGRSADHGEGLPHRLARFPRDVYERMRTAIAEGLARGERPAQLRARVAALATLEEWDGQVMTMTRTETMTALNAGAFNAALTEQERTGEKWAKRWQATHDQRVRHTHKDADGQVRDLGKAFRVGESRLQFPGDPEGTAEEVINCRCSARYGPAGDPSLTAAPTPRRTP
jgi:Phage Mu protein F like protein